MGKGRGKPLVLGEKLKKNLWKVTEKMNVKRGLKSINRVRENLEPSGSKGGRIEKNSLFLYQMAIPRERAVGFDGRKTG